MDIIEKIVIECQQQQDAIGTDKLKIVINDREVFNTLTIGSGQTKTLKPQQSISEDGNIEGFTINSGDNIKIYEMDIIGKDDLLIDYTIKADDIARGSVLLSDTLDKVDYTFVIAFRAVAMESNE